MFRCRNVACNVSTKSKYNVFKHAKNKLLFQNFTKTKFSFDGNSIIQICRNKKYSPNHPCSRPRLAKQFFRPHHPRRRRTKSHPRLHYFESETLERGQGKFETGFQHADLNYARSAFFRASLLRSLNSILRGTPAKPYSSRKRFSMKRR